MKATIRYAAGVREIVAPDGTTFNLNAMTTADFDACRNVMRAAFGKERVGTPARPGRRPARHARRGARPAMAA